MVIKRTRHNFLFRQSRDIWPRLIVCVFASLCAATNILATEPTENQKQYYDAGIIVLSGNDGDFTVGNSESVRISAGQSVILLPGTHLVAGAQVVVEVIPEVKPKQTCETSSILINPELLLSPFINEKTSAFDSSPVKQTLSIAGNKSPAVLPAVNNYTGNKSVSRLKTACTAYAYSHIFLAETEFIPVMSFGERPENIMVLRT